VMEQRQCKEESLQLWEPAIKINNLMMHLKFLEKEKQVKSKSSRQKENSKELSRNKWNAH
jgi:hypothetical protein